MIPSFIGISGKIGSGKSTVASLLESLLIEKGYNVVILPFAHQLKIEVANACQVGLDTISEKKEVFRPILQWWGTEFRRGLYGEDYWIHKWRQRVKYIQSDYEDAKVIIIADDVRFKNESETIKELGGFNLRLARGETIASIEPFTLHPSENDLNETTPDYYINNAWSKDELKRNVESLILKSWIK